MNNLRQHFGKNGIVELDSQNIVVLGAGLIGCYIGATLSSEQFNVTFLGRRQPDPDELDAGILVSTYDGRRLKLERQEFEWTNQASILERADLVLVCVKSTQTRIAGDLIHEHCHDQAIIVSFQNGVGNADILREMTGERIVLSAMVGFNVTRGPDCPHHYHKSTEGYVSLESHPATEQLCRIFNEQGEVAETSSEINSVLWGKLLLNLNNAVNVLSGLPLKQQLETRAYRRILALSIEEALGVLSIAGINPAKVGKVKAAFLPMILRLPDFLFKIIAGSMLKIDGHARSSMWEDYVAGKPPEIAFLNGAICALGRNHNHPTPINDRIVSLVKQQFGRRPDHFMDPEKLLIEVSGAN